jgi:hypothetical protein
MHLLLFLEELQHEIDLQQYDMPYAELVETPGGYLLALKV